MRGKVLRGVTSWAKSAVEFSAILTLVAGFVVLIRAVTVSRGDVETTYLLLRATDLLSILLSTILLIAPLVTIGGAGVAGVAIGRGVSRYLLGRRLHLARAVGLGVALASVSVLATVFVPAPGVWYLWASLGIGLLAGFLLNSKRTRLFLAWLNRAKMGEPRGSLVRTAALVVSYAAGFGAMALLLQVDLDRAWAPDEAISFEEGAPQVLRVVGERDGWVTLVRDEPRQIWTVPSETIVSRQVCLSESIPAYEQRLLSGWRLGVVQSGYPACEDVVDAWQEPDDDEAAD